MLRSKYSRKWKIIEHTNNTSICNIQPVYPTINAYNYNVFIPYRTIPGQSNLSLFPIYTAHTLGQSEYNSCIMTIGTFELISTT